MNNGMVLLVGWLELAVLLGILALVVSRSSRKDGTR
jgi:hypothetical protein